MRQDLHDLFAIESAVAFRNFTTDVDAAGTGPMVISTLTIPSASRYTYHNMNLNS